MKPEESAPKFRIARPRLVVWEACWTIICVGEENKIMGTPKTPDKFSSSQFSKVTSVFSSCILNLGCGWGVFRLILTWKINVCQALLILMAILVAIFGHHGMFVCLCEWMSCNVLSLCVWLVCILYVEYVSVMLLF